MFKTLGQIIKESMQDNATGKYSSARVIALMVAIGATAFMWKLVIAGGMTAEYFIAYLMYGTGNAGMNKFLDNKDNSRHEQAKSMIPKPPKDE